MPQEMTVDEFVAASRRLLTLLRSGQVIPVSQQKRINDQIAALESEWRIWLNWKDKYSGAGPGSP